MTYTFDEDAFVELDAAVAFYERQREGLGLELFEAVELAADMLCEHPQAGELTADGQTRRWVLGRFPYIMLYSVRGDEIHIEAVVNCYRAPRPPRP